MTKFVGLSPKTDVNLIDDGRENKKNQEVRKNFAKKTRNLSLKVIIENV